MCLGNDIAFIIFITWYLSCFLHQVYSMASVPFQRGTTLFLKPKRRTRVNKARTERIWFCLSLSVRPPLSTREHYINALPVNWMAYIIKGRIFVCMYVRTCQVWKCLPISDTRVKGNMSGVQSEKWKELTFQK